MFKKNQDDTNIVTGKRQRFIDEGKQPLRRMLLATLQSSVYVR